MLTVDVADVDLGLGVAVGGTSTGIGCWPGCLGGRCCRCVGGASARNDVEVDGVRLLVRGGAGDWDRPRE